MTVYFLGFNAERVFKTDHVPGASHPKVPSRSYLRTQMFKLPPSVDKLQFCKIPPKADTKEPYKFLTECGFAVFFLCCCFVDGHTFSEFLFSSFFFLHRADVCVCVHACVCVCVCLYSGRWRL